MRTLLLSLTLLCAVLSAGAGPFSVDAKLVWGCNEEKPKDPTLKPAPPELVKQLGMFKWKHYFVVTNMSATIPEKGSAKLVLSPKCTVEVKNGTDSYNAKLFGEGTKLKELDQKKTAGLVLAGDDKNETAWFAFVTPK